MKNFPVLTIVCALLASVVLALGENASAPQPAVADPATNQVDQIVARVGTVTIPKRELEMAMRGIQMQMAQRGRGIPPEQMGRFQSQVLEDMIGRELLRQECQGKVLPGLTLKLQQQLDQATAKAGGEQALQKALQEGGTSFAEFKQRLSDNLAIQLLLEQLVDQKVSISTNQVQEFYQANLERFKRPESVRASHILIKVPASAGEEIKAAKKTQIQAAAALVRGGEPFAEVARKVSECPSASQGGDLGFFPRGQMVPEFEIAAFALQPQQLSEIVTSSFGYHLILVTERRAAEIAPLAKVQADIERLLKQRQGGELARSLVQQLRSQTKVEVLLPKP